MKELKLKIKRGHYNLFKELTDKQAGELVKGMCAYMYDGKPFFTKDAYLKGVFMSMQREIDVSKQNALNGAKGAEVKAEKHRKATVGQLGVILSSVLAAAENAEKSGAAGAESFLRRRRRGVTHPAAGPRRYVRDPPPVTTLSRARG